MVFVQQIQCSALDKDDVGKAEEKVFRQKSENSPIEERVSKLEKFIFGKENKNENLENRISKILSAIGLKDEKETVSKPVLIQTPKLEAEALEEDKQQPKVIYGESFNKGVVGIIGQIENKVFNKTFNEVPFSSRVITLEEQLLTKSEIGRIRKKSLLDRIFLLMQKSGIRSGNGEGNKTIESLNNNPSYTQNLQNSYQNQVPSQNYTVDLNTGFLIDEVTREPIRDSYGNPIKVKIPQVPQPQLPNYGFQGQIPGQQNYQLNPYNQFYGNPLQQNPYGGQIPLDLLFNQGGGGLSPEPEY